MRRFTDSELDASKKLAKSMSANATPGGFFSSPGDFIDEWMELTGWSHEAVAEELSVSSTLLDSIISGEEILSDFNLAPRLEEMTGVPASEWERVDNEWWVGLDDYESFDEYQKEFPSEPPF